MDTIHFDTISGREILLGVHPLRGGDRKLRLNGLDLGQDRHEDHQAEWLSRTSEGPGSRSQAAFSDSTRLGFVFPREQEHERDEAG